MADAALRNATAPCILILLITASTGMTQET